MAQPQYCILGWKAEPDCVVWYAVLLNQIMQLSPAQIDGLPPEQKAQVLALQQQMVSLLIPHAPCMYMPGSCCVSVNQ